MSNEKQYTAKEVAVEVLKKAEELLKKSEIAKKEPANENEIGTKFEKVEPASTDEAVKMDEQGKKPAGEIEPKEHVEGKSDDVRDQKAPEANPKEKAEGNNPEPGAMPNDVHGVLKLAHFMGHMHTKRNKKQDPK